MPHRGRLEQVRRDLVEERLEGVEVVLVDEDHVDVGVLQLARGAQTGEPTAEDQYGRPTQRSLAATGFAFMTAFPSFCGPGRESKPEVAVPSSPAADEGGLRELSTA